MYLHTYEVKQKYVEVKGGSRFLKREGHSQSCHHCQCGMWATWDMHCHSVQRI